MDVNKKNLLSVVKEAGENGMSATAISQGLGFSKKNASVAELIDQMVDDGDLVEVDGGSFTKYAVAKKSSEKATAKTATVEADDDPVEDALLGFDPTSVTVPVNSHGYEIVENSKGFKVTFPSGNSHQITKTNRILVINEDKKLLVYQPEDILFAINDYCRDKQIANFVIRDLSVGRAVRAKDINTNPCIIFVQVERHNKAGLTV